MLSTPAAKTIWYALRREGAGVDDATAQRKFLIKSGFAWMLLTTLPRKQMIGCICLGRHVIVFPVPTIGPYIQYGCILS